MGCLPFSHFENTAVQLLEIVKHTATDAFSTACPLKAHRGCGTGRCARSEQFTRRILSLPLAASREVPYMHVEVFHEQFWHEQWSSSWEVNLLKTRYTFHRLERPLAQVASG